MWLQVAPRSVLPLAQSLGLPCCAITGQVWWVSRTKYDWVIQRKFPFFILEPPCDWDPLNNRSHIYNTTNGLPTPVNTSLPATADDSFLFSNTTITGIPGYPAKGMGGTLVLADSEHPSVATEGELPGINLPAAEFAPGDRMSIEEFNSKYGNVVKLDEHGLPIVTKA